MTRNDLIKNVREWLDMEEIAVYVGEEDIRKGAYLLLNCNSNRNMYNFLVRRCKAIQTRKKIAYELNKHLRILLSNVTLAEVEQLQPKVEAIAEEVEQVTEKGKEEEEVKVTFSGKRKDHDKLPKEIQVLYEQTLNILRKERQLSEKLRLLVNNPPCDRHEYTTQLIELDEKRHECWETYDHFELMGEENVLVVENNETVEVSSAVTAKEITSCRSYISKKLPKLEKLKNDSFNLFEFETLKVSVQAKYDKAVKAGAVFSQDYKDKLNAVGIKTE